MIELIKNKHLPVVAAFIIFLIIRILLLITSEHSLGGDPSVFAVMSMNTFKHGELHYFIYGEPYIGGAAIEAYLSTIPFLIFGINAFSFRLVSLSVSFLVAVLLFLFIRKHFGSRTAYISGTLISLTPITYTAMNIKGMAGYMETLLFFILLTYLVYEVFYLKKNKKRNIIKFGIISGIAWWNLEFVIPFLLFFILFWYMTDKLFFRRRLFWIFLLALMIFLSPLIYYNATHNFANFKHFMAGNAVHRFTCEHNILPERMSYGERVIDPCKIFDDGLKPPFSLKKFLSDTLIKIFGNWFYYMTTLILIGILLYNNRRSILPIIKSILPVQKFNLRIEKHNKELFIIGFFLFWIVMYILSGWTDPKHFFPIFPFIIMLTSISLGRVKNYKKGKIKINLSLILLIILLISVLVPNIKALFEPDKKDMSKTISFLKEKEIKHVYTDHPRKWKILFYTQEEIIASCNICHCVNQYPRIEERMVNDKNTAYVFWKNSNISKRLIAYLNNSSINYQNVTIGDEIIIYSLSRKVNPATVLTPCNWLDEQG